MRAGIVLCGGRSSRMGRSKAWLPWVGTPLLRHVVDTVSAAVDEILVVAAPDLDLPVTSAQRIDDRQPGLGPLAGIREGLEAMKSDYAFVTGTDSHWIDTEVVHALLDFEKTVAPVCDGHVQTLAAVYAKQGAHQATKLLDAGRRRPLDLLESLGYEKLEPAHLPAGFEPRTINTPADYLQAARAQDPGATATLEFFGRARLALGERERKVPIGTLCEVLTCCEPTLQLIREGELARGYRVSLDGRDFLADPNAPIGPGERVVILDGSAGG